MNETVSNILAMYSTNLYIIEEYMASEKIYRKLIDDVFDQLKSGFEIKELRECPVCFKFHKNDEMIQSLQLRHFLTNLIFWEPMIALNAVDNIDESYIVNCKLISSNYIRDYINNMIILPYRNKIKNVKLNKIIHDVIFNLSRISTEFNIILGLSISIETFIDVANKNPRFNEIIRTKLDKDMQPSEIEEKLNSLLKEEIEILKTEDNMLKPMLISGTGVKDKSLSEFTISGGMKPSLEGNTIPIVINSNLLVGGLSNITGYYIDSLGGRKSLIFNKMVMGLSGYFARKCMLLVSDIKLRRDTKSCRSLHPLRIEIKSMEHLKRFVGRTYRLPNQREYSVLSINDKHLIGKTIYVKSPMTCASKHGICKDCYGNDLFHTNFDGVGIGAYAGAIITNPVSQSVLSSKHILTTFSEPIEFNKEFYKFFTLSANEIAINNNDEYNIEDYSIIIIKNNIISISDLDDSNINKFCTIFHVKNNITNEIIDIRELSEKEMFLSPELSEIIKNSKTDNNEFIEIRFMDIPDDERIFLIQVENRELTRPLYKIMDLLDVKEKRAKLGITNINELAQVFLDLLIESKINVMSVHAEVLLTPLIRSIEDVLKKPDFKKYTAINDIQMLTVDSALEKNPSVLIGLSSQFLNRQLVSPLTFKKIGTSILDPLYKETL